MRLAEVLGCLSLATDLSLGLPLEKAARTTVLAAGLADALGLDAAAREAAYYTTLLRFVGCSAFAPEEARRYSAGDDIQLRSVFAYVEPGNPRDFVARTARELARDAPLLPRAAALARLYSTPSAPVAHSHAQCEAGAAIARAMGLGDEVARALSFRDERWDGRGPLGRGRGDALPLPARVADVADVAELFHQRHGADGARAALAARAGTQLDPALVDAFLRAAPGLLARVEGASVMEAFLDAEGPRPRDLDEDGLARVALGFSRAIDLKSAYTPGHSEGVAALVEGAARCAGLDDAAVRRARVAALLHDVGVLGVPTGLLDKPAALTAWERERVRSHAHLGATVLRAAPCLGRVAALACAAHEYGFDGYPRGVGHAPLELEARLLMAADVLHALREPRAHRPALDAESAARTLRAMAREGRLCGRAVALVLEASGARRARGGAWPRGLTEREVEVLRLAALGRTYGEVGALLGMSPRTAQRHVSNVYDKVGVSSRAALALFAVEHGLLDPR